MSITYPKTDLCFVVSDPNNLCFLKHFNMSTITKVIEKFVASRITDILSEIEVSEGIRKSILEANDSLSERNNLRKKRTVDKDAPKRPVNNYLMFSSDCHHVLKRENPSNMFPKRRTQEVLALSNNKGKIDISVLSKCIGGLWKNLSKEERRPYEEKWAQLRQEYKCKAVVNWVSSPSFLFGRETRI